MSVTEAQRLLADYAKNGTESSFRALVEAFIPLVHSTALRLAGRDFQLAQDVTQTVFADLARAAGGMPGETMIGGWLHRHTCFVAAHAARADHRRRTRERRAAEMNALDDPTEGRFDQLAPLLDEAVNQLPPGDRAAILLRFFEQRGFRSVGEALGSSEDAARMRVARALEKLQSMLQRRGAACSAAGLAVLLSAEAVTATPAGLAAAVAGSAITGGGAGTGVSTTLLKIITMTKLKLSLISALIVAGAGVSLVVQNQNQARLREANDLLRGQAAQLAADNAALSNRLVQANAAPADDERLELLKLRGEVGVLKRQVAEASVRPAPRAKDPAPPAGGQPDDPAARQKKEVLERALAIAKMNYTKTWVLAFAMYGADNHGQFPATFDQAAAHLDGKIDGEALLATNMFEILYQGNSAGVTNPSATIVLRESQPVQNLDGQWSRAYGFADGHSAIAVSPDGNFQNFESQYYIAPAAGGNPSPP